MRPNDVLPLRNAFVDWNLLYLFSYDANLEMRREEFGPVPGGLRVNIFAKPDETRVYHVMREPSFLGREVIKGTVVWGGDWALVREEDIGQLDVRLTIRTDDGALIDATYGGVFALGPRGFRHLVTERPRLGSEQKPFEAPVVVTPRFETNSLRYHWLTEYQCVAFGRLSIVDSIARKVSFDVYAMD